MSNVTREKRRWSCTRVPSTYMDILFLIALNVWPFVVSEYMKIDKSCFKSFHYSIHHLQQAKGQMRWLSSMPGRHEMVIERLPGVEWQQIPTDHYLLLAVFHWYRWHSDLYRYAPPLFRNIYDCCTYITQIVVLFYQQHVINVRKLIANNWKTKIGPMFKIKGEKIWHKSEIRHAFALPIATESLRGIRICRDWTIHLPYTCMRNCEFSADLAKQKLSDCAEVWITKVIMDKMIDPSFFYTLVSY